MAKRRRKDWGERSRSERIADAGRSRVDRVRALLETRQQTRPASQRLERPGIKLATTTRYTTTANPDGWAPLSAGLAAVNALLDAVADGRDRVLLG